MEFHQRAARHLTGARFWIAANLVVFLSLACEIALWNRPVSSQSAAAVVLPAPRPGPPVGQPAPELRLATVEGCEGLTLTDLVGEKPAVFMFGSLTCPRFREHVPQYNQFYERYKDEVDFYLVYIKEAHPEDQWRISDNIPLGDRVLAPRNLAQRLDLADACAERLDIQMPVLVDDMSDAAAADYLAFPTRLCIVSPSGRTAYAGLPLEFNGKAITATLEDLL